MIILYFIQIRHTDDFPSTGICLYHENAIAIQNEYGDSNGGNV